MKILLALDSFKGSCSSESAGEAVGRGIRAARPDVEVEIHGIADGGEGSAQVILNQVPGEWVGVKTLGPIPGLQVDSGFARLYEQGVCLVEMATSAGLNLMAGRSLDPLGATTYGVGQCLKAAGEQAPGSRLMLCLGGSATTDGGVGMAQALGWRFLDTHGEEIGLGGGELSRIHTLEPPKEQLFSGVSILCDVNNPLLGSSGSAAVYGPQKGADADQVRELDAGLATLHAVIQRELGLDVNRPGDGAAGGLAAGARAFLGGEIVSGIETIMDLGGIDQKLAWADWVLTGEGRLDHQSLSGKVVDGIIARAKQQQTHVGVIAGQIALSEKELTAAHIDWSYPLMKTGESLEESIAATLPRLHQAGTAFISQRGQS